MRHLHVIGTVLAVVFSVLFAALLFPEILPTHGALMSVVYVALGIGVIWAAYFGLGSLFGHLHESGRREERDENSDFV